MSLFPEWSLEKALTHYNITNWGAGYYTVNSKGHLAVTPYGPAADGVNEPE